MSFIVKTVNVDIAATLSNNYTEAFPSKKISYEASRTLYNFQKQNKKKVEAKKKKWKTPAKGQKI